MRQRLADFIRHVLNVRHPSAADVLSSRTLQRLAGVSVLGAAAFYGASFIHPEPVAKVGSLSIMHPWARGGARAGQQLPVYATFKNDGLTGDRLVSADSPIAARAIVKELDLRGGFVTARELGDLILPAQSRQTLRPGQSQITLDGVKTNIQPGDSVPLILRFDRAGTLKVMVTVENSGQPDHAEHFPSADRIDERGAVRR
jgi:copper(I)-binding protein